MKKLAALAGMAVLLCASASFAKKAMDEEEMDLITAAGQPTVLNVTVKQEGTDKTTSTTRTETTVNSDIDATGTGADMSGEVGQMEATALEAGASDIEVQLGGRRGRGTEVEVGGLVLDYSNSYIGEFENEIESGTGESELTATSSASSRTTIDAGDVDVEVSAGDNSLIVMNIEEGSQSNLRAITLNNVAGENQLANAVNLASNAFEANGSQHNVVNQSWGATYDWSYAVGTIGTATASADAGDGGDGGDSEAEARHGDVNIGPCLFSTNCPGVGGDGGDGGDGAVETKIKVAEPIPLTITGDQIVFVDVESQGDADVDANATDNSLTVLVVESHSQTNLTALTVNNVLGRNQVANGLNITSGGSTSIGTQEGGAGGSALIFNAYSQGGGTVFNTAQSNRINQFRGTPLTEGVAKAVNPVATPSDGFTTAP